jgi:hypothetical protein
MSTCFLYRRRSSILNPQNLSPPTGSPFAFSVCFSELPLNFFCTSVSQHRPYSPDYDHLRPCPSHSHLAWVWPFYWISSGISLLAGLGHFTLVTVAYSLPSRCHLYAAIIYSRCSGCAEIVRRSDSSLRTLLLRCRLRKSGWDASAFLPPRFLVKADLKRTVTRLLQRSPADLVPTFATNILLSNRLLAFSRISHRGGNVITPVYLLPAHHLPFHEPMRGLARLGHLTVPRLLVHARKLTLSYCFISIPFVFITACPFAVRGLDP